MPDEDNQRRDAAVYPLLAELDRLEVLLEEMDDLGVDAREDVQRRMTELNTEIDRLSGA